MCLKVVHVLGGGLRVVLVNYSRFLVKTFGQIEFSYFIDTYLGLYGTVDFIVWFLFKLREWKYMGYYWEYCGFKVSSCIQLQVEWCDREP